jgi:hypothetical protein
MPRPQPPQQSSHNPQPKKYGAESIVDYMPISFIHDFVKIITKMLALHLAPLIKDLISPCQSAFIK